MTTTTTTTDTTTPIDLTELERERQRLSLDTLENVPGAGEALAAVELQLDAARRDEERARLAAEERVRREREQVATREAERVAALETQLAAMDGRRDQLAQEFDGLLDQLLAKSIELVDHGLASASVERAVRSPSPRHTRIYVVIAGAVHGRFALATRGGKQIFPLQFELPGAGRRAPRALAETLRGGRPVAVDPAPEEEG